MRVLAFLAILFTAAYRCPAQQLGCAEMEEFLREAKIGVQHGVAKGVTLPKRATLDDGKITHDAGIQSVDEKQTRFESTRGDIELNFRDYWGYDVAGYELAKLLGLNMVPPYVPRKVAGKRAAVSWWVPTIMDEGERLKRKVHPPDLEQWNQEMYAARVFNQLIYNTDDNLTNFLISKDWHLWMIDFTRAFRMQKSLRAPKNLVQCDRRLLANMRELTKPLLQEKLKPYLTNSEIDGLLARRDKIVAFFDQQVADKGEAVVLFDLPRSAQACGTGL